MADARITAAQACKKHSNELWDVVALLDAACDRIDEETPSTADSADRHERMHNLLRLVQMAKGRAEAAAADLGNAL